MGRTRRMDENGRWELHIEKRTNLHTSLEINIYVRLDSQKSQVQVHQWKNRALRSRKCKRGNPTNYGVKVEWVRERMKHLQWLKIDVLGNQPWKCLIQVVDMVKQFGQNLECIRKCSMVIWDNYKTQCFHRKYLTIEGRCSRKKNVSKYILLHTQHALKKGNRKSSQNKANTVPKSLEYVKT